MLPRHEFDIRDLFCRLQTIQISFRMHQLMSKTRGPKSSVPPWRRVRVTKCIAKPYSDLYAYARQCLTVFDENGSSRKKGVVSEPTKTLWATKCTDLSPICPTLIKSNV